MSAGYSTPEPRRWLRGPRTGPDAQSVAWQELWRTALAPPAAWLSKIGVQAGQHPAGSALEYLDEVGPLHQLRNDLDGAGAGADVGDPLAGEVIVMVPTGAVDLRAPVAVRSEEH